MNEWTLAGEVVSYINSFLERSDRLPFARARVERRAGGSRKRHDVYLDDHRGTVVLTGELKVPDAADGAHPYVRDVVLDAQRKADAAGSGFFFTWNANTFVLWRTFVPGTPIHQRDFERYEVAQVESSDELDDPGIQQRIRQFLEAFIPQFAEILEGRAPVTTKPLDERFIEILEEALRRPIQFTFRALQEQYEVNARFRRQLQDWMRDEQQWTVTPETLEENLRNAAKLSNYILMTTVIFYEALRRRFQRLQRLPVRDAANLLSRLEARLEAAIRVTNDYQTVLTLDFGSRLPFLSDEAAAEWLSFIVQIDDYDFTKIDYEIIGSIFEQLISPHERHKYGQHYTLSELVDILNAFAIRRADDVLLDPTCGGGTFLVRGYLRKRFLAERERRTKSHQDLLSEIYGIELAAFPAHLSVINMAVRDLIDAENYPRIKQSDFFLIQPGVAAFILPHNGGSEAVPIPPLDAVVANFPYVRQEEIDTSRKAAIAQNCLTHFPAFRVVPSKRADVHVYMWPHSTAFLKNDGRIAILTSSTWLDTGYGAYLQHFLLDHFRIFAILESECEPWFTGARVITAATLAERETDANRRHDNTIRFVVLRKPLRQLLEAAGARNDPGSILAAAEEVQLKLTEGPDQDTENWRIRTVNQGLLRLEGTITGPVDEETADSETEIEEESPD